MAAAKKQSFFSRLASYSQNPEKQSLENFVTEVLVYLFNNDKKFRDVFLCHVPWVKQQDQKRFKQSSAESQYSIGNGLVDMVLSSTYQSPKKILVEVKIAAVETETEISGKKWVTQVQKYLNSKEGDVAYLTTKSVDSPKLESAKPDKYLGQFYFEDFYVGLSKVKHDLTEAGRLFLEFMEENEMKPFEPFTKDELQRGGIAFTVAKKCEDFLNEIRAQVEPQFQKLFKVGLKGASFNPASHCACIGSKTKLPKYNRWVGIYIEPGESGLIYGIWVTALRKEISQLKRRLEWEEGKERASYLFKSRHLKPGEDVVESIKWTLRNLENLRKALCKG